MQNFFSTNARQPTPKTRQLIYKYRGGQKVKLILGLAFLFFGGIFPTVFMWGMPFDWLLDINSNILNGNIEKIEKNYSVTQNGRHPYNIYYSYTYNNTRYTSDSTTYNSAIANEYSAGNQIKIEHLKSFPSVSRIKGMTISSFNYFISFVLLFPLIGLIITILTIRSNRREIKAYKYGIHTIADVIYADYDYSTSINNRHPYLLRWEFGIKDKKYQGSISNMDGSLLQELVKDNKITIVYLSKDPDYNVPFV